MPNPKTTASRKVLTLENINAAQDLPEITLPIPEWSGYVKLRGLTYDQISIARTKAYDQKTRETNEDLLNAWCIALGMVEPQISYLQAKDWITQRSFGPVNTILSTILAASGMGRKAVEDAKSAPVEGPQPAQRVPDRESATHDAPSSAEGTGAG